MTEEESPSQWDPRLVVIDECVCQNATTDVESYVFKALTWGRNTSELVVGGPDGRRGRYSGGGREEGEVGCNLATLQLTCRVLLNLE